MSVYDKYYDQMHPKRKRVALNLYNAEVNALKTWGWRDPPLQKNASFYETSFDKDTTR